MKNNEFEDLCIRTLDDVVSREDLDRLEQLEKANPGLAVIRKEHEQIRKAVRRSGEIGFDPWFASRIIARIQHTAISIDQQLFGLFRRFQLVVAGVILLLFVINVFFASQFDLSSIFGLTDDISSTTDVPFDFSTLLNILP